VLWGGLHLRGGDISRANQVWNTDITHTKIDDGMVYLAAIIDWHSKAVLSHEISNSMDYSLVMDVLDQALACYGQPIFSILSKAVNIPVIFIRNG